MRIVGIWFTVIAILFARDMYSQNSVLIDSLTNVLNTQTGEKRAATLINLSGEIRPKNLQKSHEYALEALHIYEQLNIVSGKAKAKLAIGICYFQEQKFSESMSSLIDARKDVEITEDSVTYAYIISAIADIIEREGKMEEAIRLHQEACGIFSRAGDKRGEAIELSSIGLIYWRRGENLPALQLFRETFEIRKKLGNKQSMAMALNNMGVVYWRMGIFEKAFEAYSESYELRKTINDLRGMIITKNNIGLIFLKLKNFPKANEHFIEALSQSENDTYKFGQAYSHFNLAQYHLDKNSYDSALVHAKKALQLYNSFKEHNSVANSINYIGLAEKGLGRFNAAEKYFLAAIDTANIINDSYSKSTSYHNLAELYLRTNRYVEALECVRKAELFAKHGQRVELNAENYLLYSNIYNKLGDNQKAFEALKNFVALKDSQSVERLNYAMMNWQIQYEVQTIEKENLLLKSEKSIAEVNLQTAKNTRNFLIILTVIILASLFWIYTLYHKNRKADKAVREQGEELKRLNQALEIQNNSLAEINRTKDKLFSIISHDLTSPFQALFGNSEILLEDADILSKEEIKNFAMDINKSSKNLLDLTRNLLTWSRVQTNNIQVNLESFILSEVINSVKGFVEFQAKLKSINLTSTIKENPELFCDKQILSNILLNLLSNAIKFTKVGGQINIVTELSPEKDSVLIHVEDTGVGISSETLEQLLSSQISFSTEGTSQEKGTGLGLLLTKELLSKIGGTLTGKSTLGKGSVFTIHLTHN